MEFPTTRWSILLRATLHGDAEARSSLEDFCLLYREPLIRFLTFKGVPAPDAEDQVQEFLLHVVDDSVLQHADRSRGRFRSFLLGALKRFLARRRTRDHAAKRGGGVTPLSLDAVGGENASSLSVSETETAFFDRQWAIAALDSALRRLELDYAERGRSQVFSVLLRFLPGSQRPPSYLEAAPLAGLSEANLKSEVHRARERLRECLRTEISRTVSAPHEVAEEMRYLGRVLMARGNQF